MEENKQEEKVEQPQAEVPKEKAGLTSDDKLWGVLGYLGVLCILPLLFKKDSVFVYFHAKQGLVLLIGWVLSWLPFGPIFGLAALILSIIGIINVLSGEMKPLPIVGELADKIKL